MNKDKIITNIYILIIWIGCILVVGIGIYIYDNMKFDEVVENNIKENVIEKYWKNEEMDHNIQNGWIKTSDMGYFDEDGYLYLTGRVDDMINVGGEKVFPNQIESIVKRLDGIDEAAVIGVSHDTFGEVTKLFVKKSQDSKIKESDIMEHCIKNLERYKVPVSIRFIEDFPQTEYGKIKRYALKDYK